MNKNPQTNELYQVLQTGLDQLQLKLPNTALEQILSYITLLIQWNKVYNLTAVTNPKAILVRHILDSLAIAPFIVGPNILDFGTGAGLPGIPLALALPNYNFVLLDSSNKKTTFLRHVVLTLKLKNIQVITQRIEEFHFAPLFATIVTRATAKTELIIQKTNHLLASSGQLLIMKGKDPQRELKLINIPFELHRIQVPYLAEERHLVKIIK